MNTNSLKRNTFRWVLNTAAILLSLYLFFLAIQLLSTSLGSVGKHLAQDIFSVTSNPFISLFIGLLITAIIQSSSTTTSMIVAAVAAESLSLSQAIPMMMGANIGTTLTSTLVALGYIHRKSEFRKAIAAGTVHDFFNLITTIILFPLEYYYGLISNLSRNITSMIPERTFSGVRELISLRLFHLSEITQQVTQWIENEFLLIFLSLLLLFLAIRFLSRIFYRLLIGESKQTLSTYMFNNPYKAFGWGTLLTAGIQSSSITTSLIVPLVATGRTSLKSAIPFVLGANLGTTLTALMAALVQTPAAITIAIAHFLFNFIGISFFLPIRGLRSLLMDIAGWFGRLTMRYRIVGFFYIVFFFFILPFALISLNDNYSTPTAIKPGKSVSEITSRPGSESGRKR